MAKSTGDTRCSKHEGSPYDVNGERRRYEDLPDANKRMVKSLLKTYEKGMRERLRDKTVTLPTEDGNITVGFNRTGIEHLARDAMLKLSGMYFSKNSLYNFDQILSKSEFLPSSHHLYKGRKDGIVRFFKYTDTDGRGVIIKVANNPNAGDKKHYFAYSIDDIP